MKKLSAHIRELENKLEFLQNKNVEVIKTKKWLRYNISDKQREQIKAFIEYIRENKGTIYQCNYSLFENLKSVLS